MKRASKQDGLCGETRKPAAFASPAGDQASGKELQPQERRRENPKSLLPRVPRFRKENSSLLPAVPALRKKFA